MRLACAFCASVAITSALAGVKIDLAPADVERALAIARSGEQERARFHAGYVVRVDAPFVERIELVSEFRRVVLLAEERSASGDRLFAYSVTRAASALDVWRRRLSVIARVRFHPQNTYVQAPPVTVTADRHEHALIGVRRDPVLALPPGRKGEFVPILGALVEGVFDAAALGQTQREFVVSLEGQTLARVVFDLGAVE